jgi:hypothetical protein
MIPRERSQVKFTGAPSGFGADTYITTIGEHMITIRLNRGAAEEIRQRFSAISNRSKMLAPEVLELMRGRIPCTFAVEHKPKDLHAINERFDRAFKSKDRQGDRIPLEIRCRDTPVQRTGDLVAPPGGTTDSAPSHAGADCRRIQI